MYCNYEEEMFLLSSINYDRQIKFFCGNCKLTCMSEHWDPQVAHCHLHHTETEAHSPAHKRILILFSNPGFRNWDPGSNNNKKEEGRKFSFLAFFVATNITKLRTTLF
jgi:hypothetical protein